MAAPDGTHLHQSGTLYAYGDHKVMAIGDRSSDGKLVMQACDVRMPSG